MVIQLCFQVKGEAHNNDVIGKLKVLKSKLNVDDRVISCHLPKNIVVNKGWSTQITNALEDIFGDSYECIVDSDTFEEAMLKMSSFREEASLKADKIFVIGEQSINNIALEISLFTDNRIEFI